MPQAKPKKTGTIVKTSFGIVDRKVLKKLRNGFDTTVLLSAVDAVDQVRYCWFTLAFHPLTSIRNPRPPCWEI